MWAFDIDYFKKQVLVWEKSLKTFRDILIRQEVTVNSEIHLITHFYAAYAAYVLMHYYAALRRYFKYEITLRDV